MQLFFQQTQQIRLQIYVIYVCASHENRVVVCAQPPK